MSNKHARHVKSLTDEQRIRSRTFRCFFLFPSSQPSLLHRKTSVSAASADDVMRNTRCSRISSSRNRRQLEYPSCICIIRDRRRIRENAHVAASNRDRLTGSCPATLFLVSTRAALDYRTSLLLTMREREDGRGDGGDGTRFANSRLIEKLVRDKNRGG